MLQGPARARISASINQLAALAPFIAGKKVITISNSYPATMAPLVRTITVV